MKSFTFQKVERLRGRTDISELFKSKSGEFLYPFKVVYRPGNDYDHPRVLISVSKRNFKKAVDRNKIKRRIREVYRQSSFKSSGKNYDVAIIYIAKEIVTYPELQEKLFSILNRLK